MFNSNQEKNRAANFIEEVLIIPSDATHATVSAIYGSAGFWGTLSWVSWLLKSMASTMGLGALLMWIFWFCMRMLGNFITFGFKSLFGWLFWGLSLVKIAIIMISVLMVMVPVRNIYTRVYYMIYPSVEKSRQFWEV